MRLLTDTCSAIKLLAFGKKLFVQGVLSAGDLIIHPRVFNETRKWPSYKKAKYKLELKLLSEIKAAPALRPPDSNTSNTIQALITATIDATGTSIGSADKDQLVSAIYCDMGLITNDAPFAIVAEVLDVTVYSAEHITLEGLKEKVINKDELKKAMALWDTIDKHINIFVI